MPTPEEVLNKYDKEKRMEDEKHVLSWTTALTNSGSGDPILIGKVVNWQVRETISQGELLRALVAYRQEYQLKTACLLAHGNKKWAIKLFGQTFALPVSIAVAVLGCVAIMFLKKHGWV